MAKKKNAKPEINIQELRKIIKGKSQDNLDNWIKEVLYPNLPSAAMRKSITSNWYPLFEDDIKYSGKGDEFHGLSVLRPKNFNWLKKQDFSQEIVQFEKYTANIAPLTDFPRVVSLGLAYSRAKDFGKISEFKNLVEIDLWQSDIDDLKGFDKLKKLRFLQLLGTGVTDLSPISSLKELTSLSVCRIKKLTSIEPLSKLKKLKGLNISQTGVTDLSDLSTLKLEKLWARRLKISDIEPLLKMKSLKRLDVAGATLTESQKEQLRKALPKTYIRD